MEFSRKTLANGLEVVAETNPHVHSVAAGFFVRTGSRDETPAVSGVSHFLEHMAFKGNDRLTADDVNRVFDEVGARYNASTSEEVTLYYAAVLPEYLPRTMELLSALIGPSLRQEDFDLEKKVILEEIAMYDDQPSFTCYAKAMETHFAGHPLSRSILGTQESITALTSEQMRDYHAANYGAANVTLAIAGNVSWSEIETLVDDYCSDLRAGGTERDTREAQPAGGVLNVPQASGHLQYVMQMAAAPPARSDDRFAAELVSVIVGDDSGSRLFWDLVDPGHAEAAEVGFNSYDGSGTWLTFLSGTPESTVENLDRIRRVFDRVNADGVTDEELEQAKNKVASRIVLRSERPMGRLSSLGGNWVYRREYCSVADDLAAYRNVTRDDVARLLSTYPLGTTTTVGVGPLESLG